MVYKNLNCSKALSYYLILVSLVLILPLNVLAQIDEAKLNHSIDRSGLQRMLTQRMLKSYCQVGQDHFYIKPVEQLNKAVTMYQEGLDFLNDFRAVDGVAASLDKINAIWPEYKKLITAKPDKKNVSELVMLNEKLLKLSHQIVLDLTAESGKELGKIVNVSGRQRMLSQRIELFYLLRDWGFTNKSYLESLATARREFTEGLAYLNNYPENTIEIKALLAKTEKSYNLFEHSLNDKGNAFLISLTVTQLLKQMNTATNLYSKSTNKL